ncbi:MAG: hypothetical protein AB1766_10970 [Pseudomonadota bacterium]
MFLEFLASSVLSLSASSYALMHEKDEANFYGLAASYFGGFFGFGLANIIIFELLGFGFWMIVFFVLNPLCCHALYKFNFRGDSGKGGEVSLLLIGIINLLGFYVFFYEAVLEELVNISGGLFFIAMPVLIGAGCFLLYFVIYMSRRVLRSSAFRA